MYRCITERKGFVIDADSMTEQELVDWKENFESYRKCFVTSRHENAERIKKLYGSTCGIYLISEYMNFLMPTPIMHMQILKKMNLQTTEMVYVSKKISFLNHAMEFCSGTIWITRHCNYEEISSSPDVICGSVRSLRKMLDAVADKFYGESAVSPCTDRGGFIISVDFLVDSRIEKLFVMGRYFSYTHYMSQNHPYSTAIFLNKNEDSKAYGSYTEIFTQLYLAGTKKIQKEIHIDGLCSVPAHLRKENRFRDILKQLSEQLKLENLDSRFQCVRDYPKQKRMSSADRQENISGAFEFQGDLAGKKILIIDDVVTTGATLRECICTLYRAGASQVVALVLAVNQYGQHYWIASEPKVRCPSCKENMHLLINSKKKSFFYLCYQCQKSKSYEDGRKEFCEEINRPALVSEETEGSMSGRWV